MKHTYLIFTLLFGCLSLSAMDSEAMNRECRVKLSEKKLVKMPDSEAKYVQERCWDNIVFNSTMTAMWLSPLAFKKVRQSPNSRKIAMVMGAFAAVPAAILYSNVKKYNLAKQGVRWHRELVIE